jgi:hypothetical protein
VPALNKAYDSFVPALNKAYDSTTRFLDEIREVSSTAVDWNELIPNFADLKAKIQADDLPGYFTDLWNSVKASDARGGDAVYQDMKEIRDRLSEDWRKIKDQLAKPMPVAPAAPDTPDAAPTRSQKLLDMIRGSIEQTRTLLTVIDDLQAKQINWKKTLDETGLTHTFENGGFQNVARHDRAFVPH